MQTQMNKKKDEMLHVQRIFFLTLVTVLMILSLDVDKQTLNFNFPLNTK